MANIFKKERCRNCGKMRQESNVAKINKSANQDCPKCGTKMYYMPNWWICIQIDGRKYPESTESASYRFAQDVLAKRMVEIRENKFFDIKKTDRPWSEGVAALKGTYPRIKSQATKTMYDLSIKILEAHGFNRLRWDQIDIERINKHIEDRQKEKVTDSTINRELATIKRMAKLLKLYELFNEIKLLEENDSRTIVLTEDQEKALLEQCTLSPAKHLRIAVLIALNTGLRKEGVYWMSWDDINFKENTITRIVKGNKKVRIPLEETLKNELIEYRKTLPLSQWVFPSPVKTGEPLRKDNHKAFQKACKDAGISPYPFGEFRGHNFRFHDLRHTFATWFLKRTGDIHTLQDILGHTDAKMTRRYAHTLDETKREAMKMYEQKKNNKVIYIKPERTNEQQMAASL